MNDALNFKTIYERDNLKIKQLLDFNYRLP